ncbi:MAG TPA: type II toxin-antitoxin system VapC family toxin [Gemmataceae bacterium]|nr:type II toxin-antitoxin system VapC family toxin [Gemmataceae bacterium]
MIVLDASVLAKCFVLEEGSHEALHLLRQNTKILAPGLSRIEVAAAICRHARQGKIPADEAKAKCREWFDFLNTDTIELMPDNELLEPAIHLSVTLKHPLQDCLYLEVMRRSNGQLVTADRKFHRRVSPMYVDVQLLPGLSAGNGHEAA